jgi:predicted HAD superfamily Cof-like phosphohydrolase
LTTFEQRVKIKVAEFQEAFNASKDHELWLKLLDEECNEVIEATAHLLKEWCDVAYILSGLHNLSEQEGIDYDVPIELGRKMATVTDIVTELSGFINPAILEEAFNRVHQSNMSKLDEDGKPIYREDGKVAKGPNYEPPVLIDLIY